jgi:Tol biopolymer transport system component
MGDMAVDSTPAGRVLTLAASLFVTACQDATGPDSGDVLPEVRDEPLPELEAVDFGLLGPNRIAFERVRLNGPSGIYLLDGATQLGRAYLGGTLTDGSSVSPDGLEVAFRTLTPFDPSLEEQSFWDLYVVQLDGFNLRKLAALSFNSEGPPSWNPGGDKIFFSQFTSQGEFKVYEQSPVSGPGDRRLIATFSSNGTTAWEVGFVAVSSRGRIAFTSPRGVHLLEADEPLASRVYEPPPGGAVRVHAPAWSPDGAHLAFLETIDGNEDSPSSEIRIKVLRMDDYSVTVGGVLTVDGFNHALVAGFNTFSACWTYDGSRIVFSSVDGDASAHIYVVPIAGGDLAPLTSAPGVTDRSVSCLR